MADRGSFGLQDPCSPSYGIGNLHDFTRSSQAIGNNIQIMNKSVTEMQSIMNRSDVGKDVAKTNDRLQQIQHYTNQLAKDTSQLLKDLNQLPSALTQSEQKQQKILKERLVNEFTKALNNFQSVQRQEKEMEKANMIKAKATSRYDPFAESKLSFEETPETISFKPPQQQSVMQLEVSDVDAELVIEREESIRKLERDITDVNQIFKDLGMLVHEQGEMIDSIEANVESASVSVEQGTEQLRQAKDYQSKARKKKCIIVLIVLIILALIIIIPTAIYAPKKSN